MAIQAEIDKLRRRIGDALRPNVEQVQGDSANSLYDLKYSNITAIEVDKNGTQLTLNTDYTVNAPSGIIIIDDSVSITSDDLLKISYQYSAYTDDEISALIDAGGFIPAVLECLYELLAGSARFYDYVQGQTQVKKSQVFANLQALVKQYEAMGDEPDGPFPGGQVRIRSRKNTGYLNRRYQRRDITRFPSRRGY